MKETKFKQTEVGMIPWDWDVINLGLLTQNTSYGVGAEAKEFLGGVKYIRITDIDDLSHRFMPSPVMAPSFYQEKHIVQKNDLLIARTGASVGKSYLYDEHDGTLVYAGFLMKLNICKANSSYVFYHTQTEFYWNWINSESARTGQPGVNLQQVKSLRIPLPSSIEEQQRIANALSDVDSLISNLEKLIAKKKNIKQGAMQQLLTGRKRLPGFGPSCRPERSTKCAVEGSSHFKMTELGPIPSDWNVKTINNVGKIVGGGTPSTFNPAYWNGPVQWFTPAELSKAGKYVSKSERTITKLGVDDCSAKMLPTGAILITTRASIGTSAILMAPACTNQGFQSLVVNDENSNEFLYYLLSTKVDEMLSLASGSTFLEISPKKLGGILLQMPSSKAEQTAIASVLSDMDSEIQTLETKLAKYRKLKTGMMQQLLTGKIRLF